jgi:5'-nucleotidase
MWGIPSLAISIWEHTPAHLWHAIRWLQELLRRPELLPEKPGGLWNVNFPACHPKDVQGVEITSMSTVMFEDSYEQEITEHGLIRFRLVGSKPSGKFLQGTDDFALARNRIAVTPMQLNQSHPSESQRLAALRDWGSF